MEFILTVSLLVWHGRVLLIAPDEWKDGKIRVKNMKAQTEKDENQYDILYDDFVKA